MQTGRDQHRVGVPPRDSDSSGRCAACCVTIVPEACGWLCSQEGLIKACQTPLPRPQAMRPGSQPLWALQSHAPPRRQVSNQDQDPPGTQGASFLKRLFTEASRRNKKTETARREGAREREGETGEQDWHRGEGKKGGGPTQTPARQRDRQNSRYRKGQEGSEGWDRTERALVGPSHDLGLRSLEG